MTPHQLVEAVQRGYDVGMHQHREEITNFAFWLDAHRERGGPSARVNHVVEIGTLHGGTMTLWSQLCPGNLLSLDMPMGVFGGAAHHYSVAKCEERNKHLGDQIGDRFYGILGDSHDPEVAERVRAHVATWGAGGAGGPVDLLFIDGDHSVEGITRDFLEYASLVRGEGLIVFHDIADTELHRRDGCRVDLFWRLLRQLSSKGGGYTQEFCLPGAPWGGIGVYRTPARIF